MLNSSNRLLVLATGAAELLWIAFAVGSLTTPADPDGTRVVLTETGSTWASPSSRARSCSPSRPCSPCTVTTVARAAPSRGWASRSRWPDASARRS